MIDSILKFIADKFKEISDKYLRQDITSQIPIDGLTTTETNYEVTKTGDRVDMTGFLILGGQLAAGVYVNAFNVPQDLRANKYTAFSVAKLNGGIQIEKLWENSNPSNSFAPEKIEIQNLKQYDRIEIVARRSSELKDNLVFTYVNLNNLNGTITLQFIYGSGNSIKGYYRPVSMNIADNNITFNSGYLASGTSDAADNRCAIPVEIYGVKLIGGGNRLKSIFSRFRKAVRV